MGAKSALITGITGQDGYYLADLLLGKGYDVHGLSRGALPDHQGLAALRQRAGDLGRIFTVHAADLCRPETIERVLRVVRPDEIYNLAAQTQVSLSFEDPEATFEANAMGVLRLLESVRHLGIAARLFQAASAELFGKPSEWPQSETTLMRPLSPYASSKLYAFWIVRNYREAFRMGACNGILFNHESPMRPEHFVTRKITSTLARLRAGEPGSLRLGRLDVRRDWGYAKDFVEAMWLMLQQPSLDDFVISTGESRTVREFVELAAGLAGFRLEWEGEGVQEVGRDAVSGRVLVEIDPRFYRPAESEGMRGNASKAARMLGWEPKVRFSQLVELMIRADMERHAPR